MIPTSREVLISTRFIGRNSLPPSRRQHLPKQKKSGEVSPTAWPRYVVAPWTLPVETPVAEP